MPVTRQERIWSMHPQLFPNRPATWLPLDAQHDGNAALWHVEKEIMKSCLMWELAELLKRDLPLLACDRWCDWITNVWAKRKSFCWSWPSVASSACLSGCSTHVVLPLGGTVNERRLLTLSAWDSFFQASEAAECKNFHCLWNPTRWVFNNWARTWVFWARPSLAFYIWILSSMNWQLRLLEL